MQVLTRAGDEFDIGRFVGGEGRNLFELTRTGVEASKWEESRNLSFAGQFFSYLKMSGMADVLQHVKKRWPSAHSERSLHYRIRNELPLSVAAMGVMVAGTTKIVDAPHNIYGDILVVYRTDPGWVPVLPTASALLIERGSPVTHVAIVARELGIPMIAQISGVTDRVQTGMRLAIDGAAGTIQMLTEKTEIDVQNSRD